MSTDLVFAVQFDDNDSCKSSIWLQLVKSYSLSTSSSLEISKELCVTVRSVTFITSLIKIKNVILYKYKTVLTRNLFV